MLVSKARLLLIVLWAGSLWTIGYVVAPTLFATLHDRALAGVIAGSMFTSSAWISMACGGALLGVLSMSQDLSAQQRKTLYVIVLAMLVVMLANHFGLRPKMAEMKALGDKASFGKLHGVSMLMHVVQSVLAVALVVKNK